MELQVSKNWFTEVAQNPEILNIDRTVLRGFRSGSMDEFARLAPCFAQFKDNQRWAFLFVTELKDQGSLEKIRKLLPSLTLDQFFESIAAFDAIKGRNASRYIGDLSNWVEENPLVREEYRMYIRYYLMHSELDFSFVLSQLNSIKPPADIYSNLGMILENAHSNFYTPDNDLAIEKQIKLLHFGWNIQYPYSLLLLKTYNEKGIWNNFEPNAESFNYSTYNEDLHLASLIKGEPVIAEVESTEASFKNELLYELLSVEELMRHCLQPWGKEPYSQITLNESYDFNC